METLTQRGVKDKRINLTYESIEEILRFSFQDKYCCFERSEQVKQLSNECSNVDELARELGIRVSMLYKWRNDYNKFGEGSFPSEGTLKQTSEQKRISELEAKLKDAELESDIFKKEQAFFQELSMIFDFIKNHMSIFSIEKMCNVLQVSQSDYYRCKNKIFPKRVQKISLMKEKITTIYFESKQRYGSLQMAIELNALGFKNIPFYCCRIYERIRFAK